MSLKLSDLTRFTDIVIQCHDEPDADALASGFALKWYLSKKGISARFVYGGASAVQKSNLALMIEHLGIEVEHVTLLEKPELLVTVDCQYGESNVTRFDAECIAVIDHHQDSGHLPDLSEVRSNMGSCATLIYELLKKEGIDINEDKCVATALYYGLMTDTNGFAELSHPSDKDLRDFASFSKPEIILFKNSNISKQELIIAGEALRNAHFDEKYAYATMRVRPCDPNILGMTSDMLMEVDSIATCVVYSMLPFGIKLSVRSCVKEVKASELAFFITEGLGGGGGHLFKAGGFIKKQNLMEAGVDYTVECVENYIKARMDTYFKTSRIIYAGQYQPDLRKYKKYRKKEITVGFVPAIKLAPAGSLILIRTLEGDVDVTVEEDLLIIIGINGEIYPCRKAKFDASYILSDEKYVFPGEYPPAVVNTFTGDRIELLPYASACIAKGGAGILARKLDHRVKVFTAWDTEKYYLGVEGDFLAVRADDASDIYVIAGDIFERTYEYCDEI